jgi:hypothetical protein
MDLQVTTTIKIEHNGRELELTRQEAEELYNCLKKELNKTDSLLPYIPPYVPPSNPQPWTSPPWYTGDPPIMLYDIKTTSLSTSEKI